MDMFTEDDKVLKTDLESALQGYWYVVECYKSGCSLFPNEMESHEKFIKDMMKKYNIS